MGSRPLISLVFGVENYEPPQEISKETLNSCFSMAQGNWRAFYTAVGNGNGSIPPHIESDLYPQFRDISNPNYPFSSSGSRSDLELEMMLANIQHAIGTRPFAGDPFKPKSGVELFFSYRYAELDPPKTICGLIVNSIGDSMLLRAAIQSLPMFQEEGYFLVPHTPAAEIGGKRFEEAVKRYASSSQQEKDTIGQQAKMRKSPTVVRDSLRRIIIQQDLQMADLRIYQDIVLAANEQNYCYIGNSITQMYLEAAEWLLNCKLRLEIDPATLRLYICWRWV